MPNFKATKKLRQKQSRALAVTLFCIQNGTTLNGTKLTKFQLALKQEQLDDLKRALKLEKTPTTKVEKGSIYKSLRAEKNLGTLQVAEAHG